MKSRRILALLGLYWMRLSVFGNSISTNSSNVNNILFFIIDDLRHLPEELQTKFPNIHFLANKGVQFRNTFAQQSLCAPSRNSLLTGRRPNALKLYDFDNYWRKFSGNFTTLPQHFKQNGYETVSFGKVFHPGISSNYSDDYPYSWTRPTFHPSTERFKNLPVCYSNKTNTFKRNLICPVNVKNQPEETLPDLQILNAVKDFLKTRDNKSKPFFLGVGFHKPHIPFKCPRKYLSKFPIDRILLPTQRYWSDKIPEAAYHPWSDLREREDIAALNLTFPYGEMPKKWSRKIIQNYWACVSYVDDLIGQILELINIEKTVVVLISDHGWSLGENSLWAKYSNFDHALKVPFIIVSPKIKPKEIDLPVELVDLYPTLLDIAKINSTKCRNISAIDCYEGESLVPLMMKQSIDIKDRIAYSQYPRPESKQWNSDKPKLDEIKIMGYSLRSKRYRYTEWIGFDNRKFVGQWNEQYGTELYDHAHDNEESINLSGNPEFEQLIRSFRIMLKEKFS